MMALFAQVEGIRQDTRGELHLVLRPSRSSAGSGSAWTTTSVFVARVSAT